MAELLLSVTATGASAPAPVRAAAQAVAVRAAAVLRAVAAAFADHGVDHPLADAHRAGAGWLAGYHADPVIVRGVTRYSTHLERDIEDLVRGAAPDASLTVDWEPLAAALDGYAWTGPAVYRLAELFATLDGGVPLAEVGRGLLTPAPSWAAMVQAPRDLLYEALGQASAIVGVDWRATRTEVADAIGALRVLPTGERTVAQRTPGFADLRAGWTALDHAEALGHAEAPDGGSPLWSVAETLTAAFPDRLLVLENGDTPGFLAVTPDLAAEVLSRATTAGIPLSTS